MLAEEYASLLGMPGLFDRTTFVPHPIWYTPTEEKVAKAYGNDPRRGGVVVEEIAESLTKPLSEAEVNPQEKPVPEVPRLLEPDTEENLLALFNENGWVIDGLPIVLPTEERVAEMLTGTSHAPDEEFTIRAAYESYTFTVEKAAANAVMVGATPEMFPLLLCLAANGAGGISTSTQSFAAYTIVNGPIAKEIGMNDDIGALGPFNQANSVIGRYRNFISRNLGGGAIPWKNHWGGVGNSLNYNNVTFAENEDALPEGWDPLHVQMGFEPEDSVVTVASGHGIWHIWNTTSSPVFGEQILQSLVRNYPDNGFFAAGALLLVDPDTAFILYTAEGFESKEEISQYGWENTWVSLEDYWGYNYPQNMLYAVERKIEPHYSRATLPQDTLIHFFDSPERIQVVVVGGGTNPFSQMGAARSFKSYSVDEWR